MLLVIFGAGASYDSSPLYAPRDDKTPNARCRPPLTQDLFEDRQWFREPQREFSFILPLIARLSNHSSGLAVEEVLRRFSDEASAYPERLSELAAVRYYLQRVIWEYERNWIEAVSSITNYVELLDRIQCRRKGKPGGVVFATFNYDRLFEFAATYFISGRASVDSNGYDTMDFYVAQSHFPLVKLHGSLDWGHRIGTPVTEFGDGSSHVWTIANYVIRQFPTLDVSRDIVKTNDRPPGPVDGHPVVPAIAIPIDKKAEFVCPQTHLDFLASALPEVTSILTIGWRGVETHFHAFLKKHCSQRVQVTAVSGNQESSRETLDHLAPLGIAPNSEPFDGGFTKFVMTSAADEFLARAIEG